MFLFPSYIWPAADYLLFKRFSRFSLNENLVLLTYVKSGYMFLK